VAESLDDPGLPEWQREAIKKADRRFQSQRDEPNRFSELAKLCDRQIRGTWFSCYDASRRRREAQAHDGEAAQTDRYANTALGLYSEQNRFVFLCDLAMTAWLGELPLLLQLIYALETDSGDADAEWQAESFGLAVLPDCYRVGMHGGGAPPMFAVKDLIIEFLDLVIHAMILIEDGETQFGFDPRTLPVELDRIRAVLIQRAAREEQAER
jgi:hypothetical protein